MRRRKYPSRTTEDVTTHALMASMGAQVDVHRIQSELLDGEGRCRPVHEPNGTNLGNQVLAHFALHYVDLMGSLVREHVERLGRVADELPRGTPGAAAFDDKTPIMERVAALPVVQHTALFRVQGSPAAIRVSSSIDDSGAYTTSGRKKTGRGRAVDGNFIKTANECIEELQLAHQEKQEREAEFVARTESRKRRKEEREEEQREAKRRRMSDLEAEKPMRDALKAHNLAQPDDGQLVGLPHLKVLASTLGIKGVKKMKKQDIWDAVRQKLAGGGAEDAKKGPEMEGG